MDKNDVIKNIYYDRFGYSSIQETYHEAKYKDPSITLNMLKIGLLKNCKEPPN